jgi:hypothetical protein
MKTCKCCGETKPLDMFHKDAAGICGRKGKCKECISAAIKKDRVANHEKYLAKGRNYREANHEKVVDYYRKYREENREKIKAWQDAHQEQNKDHIADRRKKYYAENKDRIRTMEKQYAKANPEIAYAKSRRYRDRHPEKVAQLQKEYRAKNPHVFVGHAMKRTLAKKQRVPNWLTDFDHIHIKCLYQLAAMRSQESGQAWQVDHIVPLQGKRVSGLHVPSNLRVITASENRRKKNAFVVE